MALNRAPSGDNDGLAFAPKGERSLLLDILLDRIERRRIGGGGNARAVLETGEVRDEERAAIAQMSLPGVDIDVSGRVVELDASDDDKTGDEAKVTEDFTFPEGITFDAVRSSELFMVFLALNYDIIGMQSDDERLFMEEVTKRLIRFFAKEMGVDDEDIGDLAFRQDTFARGIQVDFKLDTKKIGIGDAFMKLGGLIKKMGSGSWKPIGNDIIEVEGITLSESAISTISG